MKEGVLASDVFSSVYLVFFHLLEKVTLNLGGVGQKNDARRDDLGNDV
jgi:hypothetical protein